MKILLILLFLVLMNLSNQSKLVENNKNSQVEEKFETERIKNVDEIVEHDLFEEKHNISKRQTIINICNPNPCNQGMCVASGVNTFSCQCTSTSCINGGLCRVISNVISCLCPPNFSGPSCQFSNANPCMMNNMNVCLNGGVCSVTNVFPFYTCRCLNGFTGSNCNTLMQVTTIANFACVDKASFCPSITHLCRTGATISGVETVASYCRRSCNNCIGTVTSINCFDSLTVCPLFVGNCNFYYNGQLINTICRRTCNSC